MPSSIANAVVNLSGFCNSITDFSFYKLLINFSCFAALYLILNALSISAFASPQKVNHGTWPTVTESYRIVTAKLSF